MRTEVTGQTKVFRKDFDERAVYSTSIGKKKMDGTWDNAYINLQFRKGVEIADGTIIDIQNGWLTFYLNREKKPVWQIFINEFEALDVPEGAIPAGFTAIEDDSDIPF